MNNLKIGALAAGWHSYSSSDRYDFGARLSGMVEQLGWLSIGIAMEEGGQKMEKRAMKIVFLYLLSAVFVARSNGDSGLTARSAEALNFEQKLGGQVSLDLSFLNEEGRLVQLKDCLEGKPAILALGYYECPMLCNLVLNGIMHSLQEIKRSDNEQVNLLFVSIDPRETPALASAKKETYLKRFGRPSASPHWNFLTGKRESIDQLATEVGFHYKFDPVHNQFAHPSGIVVISGDGRIARYFFGVEFPAPVLNQALKAAEAGEIGSATQPLLMLCSRFMALTGKYSGIIMASVRALAIVSILCLAGFVAFSRKRNKGGNG